MNIFKLINKENCNFKPFKKGNKLLNFILEERTNTTIIFCIFSSSKCKNPKMCKLEINKELSNPFNIQKLINLLNSYTWNISQNTIKTTENNVSYPLKSLMNRHSINLDYKLNIIDNSSIIYSFVNALISNKSCINLLESLHHNIKC